MLGQVVSGQIGIPDTLLVAFRGLQTVLGLEVDLIRTGAIDNPCLQQAIDRSHELVWTA